jgi:hypothetical protein
MIFLLLNWFSRSKRRERKNGLFACGEVILVREEVLLAILTIVMITSFNTIG